MVWRRILYHLGYFSGDFREHPVSTLTAGLYESHNRDFFEIYAFSYGPDTNDEMNIRIKAGVDYFHDVQRMCNISHPARECEIILTTTRLMNEISNRSIAIATWNKTKLKY